MNASFRGVVMAQRADPTGQRAGRNHGDRSRIGDRIDDLASLREQPRRPRAGGEQGGGRRSAALTVASVLGLARGDRHPSAGTLGAIPWPGPVSPL